MSGHYVNILNNPHAHTHTNITYPRKKSEPHTTLIGHAGDKLYSKFTNHKLDHVYTPTFFMYLITTISHMVMHLLISWWVVSNNRCLQILFLNLVFILLLQYTHIKNSVLILFCFFSPLCFLFYFFPTGRNGNHNNWIPSKSNYWLPGCVSPPVFYTLCLFLKVAVALK